MASGILQNMLSSIEMSVTSLWFFAFLAAGAVLYYLLPKKCQWIVLLVMSVIFYMMAATPYTFIYVAAAALIAWYTGRKAGAGAARAAELEKEAKRLEREAKAAEKKAASAEGGEAEGRAKAAEKKVASAEGGEAEGGARAAKKKAASAKGGAPETGAKAAESEAEAARRQARAKAAQAERRQSSAKRLLAAAIVAVVLMWLLTAGHDLWVSGSAALHSKLAFVPSLPALPLAAAMGMGYYTAQLIGYMTDCYWGTCAPQKNILKMLLFTCFFPQMVTGPISRYNDLEGLYSGHSFKYANLCRGAQRILWGLFKKLVIADRTALFINGFWDNPEGLGGIWYVIVWLLYPLQLYADFSGCADIVLGSAEIFDIRLAENFDNPFFSTTIREFWRRWHITLGSFARDYVMFPIMKSPRMLSFSKKLKERFGKKWAKFLSSAVGAAGVWLVVGVWHGGFKHILGVSLYYFVLIELAELTEPFFKRQEERFGVKTDSFGWHFFCSARTYIIMATGSVFFKAGTVTEALGFIKGVAAALLGRGTDIGSFLGGSVTLGSATLADANVLVVGVLLLFAAAAVRAKYGSVRDFMEAQPVLFRWGAWLALFFALAVFGMYGPGYSASAFIYQAY